MIEFTEDIFLGGAIKVFQPKTGFRAGTDSVLLAAALDAGQTGQCLEFGCGSGGALLPAAWRLKEAHFTGIDRDEDMLALATRGIARNQYGNRVCVKSCDVAHFPADWAGYFDLVFSNPPFFQPGEITPPGEGKSGAYLASVSLQDWIASMLSALRPKGRFVIIHRAAVLDEIMAALFGQAGEIAVLPVYSYPGSDAKRVIVRARKGLRRGPVRLTCGISLYDSPGGDRSEVALAVSARGEGLSWGGRP